LSVLDSFRGVGKMPEFHTIQRAYLKIDVRAHQL
jgi:hypothetical protein